VTKDVPLNPRQRVEAPGCSENGFLLQRIQKHVKRNRKRLSVVFLDLAKAFDTVSHKHIQQGLKRFWVKEYHAQPFSVSFYMFLYALQQKPIF
jgi:hypothetical protein